MLPRPSTSRNRSLTRYSEYILKRDGDDVEVGNDCYPTAGSWLSPYEGDTQTVPSKISIDHMVPLKNAWIVSFPPLMSDPF